MTIKSFVELMENIFNCDTLHVELVRDGVRITVLDREEG